MAIQTPKRDNRNEPLFTGRTADIFEWQPGKFIKLFKKAYMLDDVEKEIRGTLFADEAGLPAPKIDPKVRQHNFRYGIVMDKLDGIPLKEQLLLKPWRIKHYFNLMAKEHVNIHQTKAPKDLPCQVEAVQDVLTNSICFTQSESRQLQKLLLSLPPGDTLCHGDMHPENLIYSGDNLTTIDWCDARRGNPLGDLANSALIMSHFWRRDFPPSPLFFVFAGISSRLYLKIYSEKANEPLDWEQFRYWCCIFSAYQAEKRVKGCREQVFLVKSVRRQLRKLQVIIEA